MLPPNIPVEVRREFERLEKRITECETEVRRAKSEIAECETEIRRAKSDMRAEVNAGFDGIKQHLPYAIAAAVAVDLTNIRDDLSKLNDTVDKVLEKAKEAEAYRKARIQIEAEDRERQDHLITRHKSLADIEHVEVSTQVAKLDVRRKYLVPLLVALLLFFGGLGAAVIGSYRRAPADDTTTSRTK